MISDCIGYNAPHYKIKQIDGEILNIGFPILQQLTVHSEVHCLYRFKERVSFRTDPEPTDPVESISTNYASYCSEYGTIHFIILPNKE